MYRNEKNKKFNNNIVVERKRVYTKFFVLKIIK